MQTSLITVPDYANPARGEWRRNQIAGVGLAAGGNEDQEARSSNFPSPHQCPGSPMAEAIGLNPIRCGFDSRPGHYDQTKRTM